MKRYLPVQPGFSVVVVAALLGSADAAQAGWDNVFQVCCNDCRPRTIISYAAPAPVAACAPPAQVQYQQRCFYEPVTVMQPQRVVEAVPVQTRSYYYEPVTSYTYRSFYDPCSCTCQQIAIPRTSYRLREQCNTVMRYVERIQMVPVQTQRKVCETQPVVTYYGAPTRTYYAPTEVVPVAPVAPAAPRVEEVPGTAPSVLPESTDRISPPGVPTTPGTSYPRSPRPSTFNARTTSSPTLTGLSGEVVARDTVTPRPGVKLVFVNANDLQKREYVTTDSFGQFDVRLAAGTWYLYLGDGNGRAEYHKKLEVSDSQSASYKVVSR